VDAVKVHGVWVIAAVNEIDADTVALSTADGGARDAPVIRPGREFYTGYYFDISVSSHDAVLA